MKTSALQNSCTHIVTPQERDRDPNYQACTADPGQPCRWAARYDGITDPPFHSERLEAAARGAQPGGPQGTLDPRAFDAAVLGTGLV